MLHIVLLILKFIGWFLLAVLCLVLLLVCVVLFTPLRYQGAAECRGGLDSLSASVRFSFLLHLIRGKMTYADKNMNLEIWVAWKKLGDKAAESAAELEHETAHKLEESLKDEAENMDAPGKNAAENKSSGREDPKEKKDFKEEKESKKKDLKEDKESEKKDLKEDKESEKKESKKKDLKGKKSSKKKDSKEKDSKENKSSVSGKDTGNVKAIESKEEAGSLFERIQCTFQKICDTIEALLRKKNLVMDFITDEIHKAAFFKAMQELKKLLKRILPGKLQADVHFGFEDPALTGRALALASMLFPLWGEQVKVRPDFGQKVLEGQVMLQGRLRASVLAAAAWNLVWDKNVRTTIRHAMKFRFE